MPSSLSLAPGRYGGQIAEGQPNSPVGLSLDLTSDMLPDRSFGGRPRAPFFWGAPAGSQAANMHRRSNVANGVEVHAALPPEIVCYLIRRCALPPLLKELATAGKHAVRLA